MQQTAIILFWLAFCGLLMATVVYAFEIIRHRRASVLAARVLTALAWLTLTASIGLNSLVHHGTPLNGPNQMVLIAWALVLVYFLFEYLLKFTRYGAAFIPLAAALMFTAQIIAPKSNSIVPTPTTVTAQMNSAQVSIHVLLIIFANALLLIACMAGVLYLYQDRALRRHSNSALARALPPLANIERLWLRVLSIGLPIYFAGQVLGVTRAIVVDAHLWYADIRIILSGAVLILFGLTLLFYIRGRTQVITLVRLSVAGGVLIAILMIIARSIPIGFHVFGAL
jgi:ABC-type uncharacterized transport system permease subunit